MNELWIVSGFIFIFLHGFFFFFWLNILYIVVVWHILIVICCCLAYSYCYLIFFFFKGLRTMFGVKIILCEKCYIHNISTTILQQILYKNLLFMTKKEMFMVTQFKTNNSFSSKICENVTYIESKFLTFFSQDVQIFFFFSP